MIITIAGKAGAGKSTIAKLLAKNLNYQSYSMGDLRGKIAQERGLTIDELNHLKDPTTHTKVDDYQKKLGRTSDNFIIDGWLSWHFIPHSFKVYLDVNSEEAARRIFHDHRESDEPKYKTIEECRKTITKRYDETRTATRALYGADFDDRNNYDLVIDGTKIAPEEVAETIVKKAKEWDQPMVIAYKGNIASANIGEALEAMNVPVHWISEPALNIKTLPPAKQYIIVYSHKSEKGVPSLTVHSTGNFHSADIGGLSETLQLTNPVVNAELLKRVSSSAPEGFQVTYEATHHGPTGINNSLCFVELGSSEEQWSSSPAIHAVALSVKQYLEKTITQEWKPSVGIGGTHYPERFTKRTLKEGIAFGHIIPAHALPHLKQSVAEQVITKTVRPVMAVLDKSRQGLAEERKALLELLEKYNLPLKKLQ